MLLEHDNEEDSNDFDNAVDIPDAHLSPTSEADVEWEDDYEDLQGNPFADMFPNLDAEWLNNLGSEFNWNIPPELWPSLEALVEREAAWLDDNE